MNTIYLIRHGEKVGHAGDPGLTLKGQLQTKTTAAYLKRKNITKIYSSTFKRTKETAQTIDDFLKVGIAYDDRFRERMNWGSVPGQSLEDFLKEWKYSNHHRYFEPKAGISSFESGKNGCLVINEILRDYPDKNIAVITHGGVICDILRNFFAEEELEKEYPDFLNKLDSLIKECSITLLTSNKEGLTVKKLGYTKHLDEN